MNEETMVDAINSEVVGSAEMEGKYLTFFTDNQLFGVPIADVVQIVQVQPITVVPDYPFYAKGIINLRGDIIPVIDMRLRLHKEEIEYNERTCIIIIMIKDIRTGFIVDSVNEVADIPDEEISPPPKFGSTNIEEQYLTGISRHDEHIVLLLDAKRVLSQEDLFTLQSMQ